MVSDVYKGRLYQNRKGLVINLIFMVLVVIFFVVDRFLGGLALGAWIMFIVYDFYSYSRMRRNKAFLLSQGNRILTQFGEIILIYLQSHKFPVKLGVDVALSDFVDGNGVSLGAAEYSGILTTVWKKYTDVYDENASFDVSRYHAFCSSVIAMKGELTALMHLSMLVDGSSSLSVSLTELIKELDRMESYEHIGGAFDAPYMFSIYSSIIFQYCRLAEIW